FLIQNNIKNVNVLNFALPDEFIEHGSNEDLLKNLKLDSTSISKKILKTIYDNKKALLR
ncbi:hypothetical protein LCGC14_2769040, partial [marine sediment metagenome]